MKIAIIGAGRVGSSLARAFNRNGHDVLFGVRDPAKISTLLVEIGGGHALTPYEAAQQGDMVVITVPWPAVREVIPILGNLAGKIVIDATNRFASQPGDGASAAADIAALASGARVIKAFNTMGAETMDAPVIGGERLTAFICGDDADAKARVMHLAEECGMDALDAGGLVNASYTEMIVPLWVNLSRMYGRRIAFRLLREDA